MKFVFRVTTFLPFEALPAVKTAVSAAGGAAFGVYSDVFWTSAGVEQFRPLPGAKPSFGSIGQVAEVASHQLVFSVPKDEQLLERVLEALRRAHPWEEPVIFIDETRVK